MHACKLARKVSVTKQANEGRNNVRDVYDTEIYKKGERN
jgi:hypothetical protein